jgi:predicted Ser/Thr protein kinase
MRRKKSGVLLAEYVHDCAEHIFQKYVTNLDIYFSYMAESTQESFPDLDFMEKIEAKAGVIPVTNKASSILADPDDFRRQIACFMSNLLLKGKTMQWSSNPSLANAILGYMAENHGDLLDKDPYLPKYRSIKDSWEQTMKEVNAS